MQAIHQASTLERAPSTDLSTDLTATMPPDQMEELRAIASTLAATDAAFRASLLHDPKETLSMLIGMNSGQTYELPQALNVIALEQEANTTFIVIPSPDKAAHSTSELAKLSLELATKPELRELLTESPREVLEAFLQRDGAAQGTLPADTSIRIFREEPGELIIIAPNEKPFSPMVVRPHELIASSELQNHMSCLTCDCLTARSCLTGECLTASSCLSWSFSTCR